MFKILQLNSTPFSYKTSITANFKRLYTLIFYSGSNKITRLTIIFSVTSIKFWTKVRGSSVHYVPCIFRILILDMLDILIFL